MTEALSRQADRAMTARNNVEALRTRIVQRYETLSPRLKQVAAYALFHSDPNDLIAVQVVFGAATVVACEIWYVTRR